MVEVSQTLVAGTAQGLALRLDEPLSFWGGINPTTGEVIDPHHPQRGQNLRNRVLVMPYGRGSSSSSQVLAEALRLGSGPVAVVMREPDPIVMLGSLVAAVLYEVECPVVVAADYDSLADGMRLEIG